MSRNDWNSILRGNQPLITQKREDIELRGTPFVFDEWLKGSVVVFDSLFSENNNLFKLNVSEHEIWIQAAKGEPLILTDARIVGLDLNKGDSVLHFRKMPIQTSDKKTTIKFAQVLYKGNRFALCKYVNKEFIAADGVEKGLVTVGRFYDSYQTTTTYYTIDDKRNFRKVQLKRNDLYKLDFPLVEKNRDAVNQFCKENDISNPLDEQDAIDLTRFLDNLKQ